MRDMRGIGTIPSYLQEEFLMNDFLFNAQDISIRFRVNHVCCLSDTFQVIGRPKQGSLHHTW